MIRRIAGSAAVALVLSAAPTAAWAVSVSSQDGFGNQSLTAKGAWSFSAGGTLTSRYGSPVYYQGKLVYDGNTDDACGRYTSNTTSRSAVSRGGKCSGDVRAGQAADAAAFKVCRDINNLPDDCGAYSTQRY